MLGVSSLGRLSKERGDALITSAIRGHPACPIPPPTEPTPQANRANVPACVKCMAVLDMFASVSELCLSRIYATEWAVGFIWTGPKARAHQIDAVAHKSCPQQGESQPWCQRKCSGSEEDKRGCPSPAPRDAGTAARLSLSSADQA